MLVLTRLGYHAEQTQNTTEATPLQGECAVRIQYAVNVVSLMHLGWQRPWKRGVGLPGMLFAPVERLIQMALEVGYHGVQMLPIRGATGLEPHVLLFEDAWNAVWGPIQALRRANGASGLPSTIAGWIVSPNPGVCAKIWRNLKAQDAIPVAHTLERTHEQWGGLLEVTPDLGLTAAEIAVWCRESSHFLVLDTYHLRRLRRDGGKSLLCDNAGDWRPAARLLAPHVRAVHVNDTRENVASMMADGIATMDCAGFVLTAAAKAGVEEVIMVAEYKPVSCGVCSTATARRWAQLHLERLCAIEIVSSGVLSP